MNTRPVGEFEPWMLDGLCTQVAPDTMYPEKGESNKPAKSICRGCPVTTQCLTFALDNRERFGVWGGLSELERNRLGREAA